MKRLLLILSASCGAVYAQQNALLLPWTPQQFTNTNGTVLANGKVCTYQAGTSTGLATYTDSTASVSNNVPPNAILLDSTGRPTSGGIWLSAAKAYKITVLTAGSDSTCNTGVTIKTQDNVAASNVGANNTFTGVNNFKNINSIRFADQFPGADCGAKINAASADAGISGYIIVNSNCGVTISSALSLSAATTLQFLNGFWNWTPGVQTISVVNVTIEGLSPVSTQFNISAATGDLFAITANGFSLQNMYITPGPSVTRTAGCVLNIQGGGAGLVNNVLLNDPYCGFKSAVAGSNGWRFNNISAQSAGGNWNSLWAIGPLASGTITQWQVQDVTTSIKGSVTSAPLILLDSGTDGFTVVNFNGGTGYLNTMPTNLQPTLLIQSTGASFPPRWSKFTNFYAESGFSAEGCTITAGVEISFVNDYFASSLRGCDISGGTGIHFSRTVFVNHQQQGVLLSTPAIDVSFVDCDFSDNSAASNGGTSHLLVAANTSDFRIIGNRFGNQLIGNANQAGTAVSVLAGTSNNYMIALNRGDASFVNTFLVDNGTGTGKYIYNIPTTSADRVNFSGTVVPTVAGGTDLGATSLPFADLWIGTAATNNFKLQPAATAGARVITITDPVSPSTVGLPLTIGSGTATMTTAAIAAQACGTVVTVAATGVATTDSIYWNDNAQPAAATNGVLPIKAWPTSGNVNFFYCNPTANPVTPAAATLNWRVAR